MKVVLGISNFDPEGFAGTEHFVYSLAEDLAEAGCAVTVAVPASLSRNLPSPRMFQIRFFGDYYVPSRGEVTGRDAPKNINAFRTLLAELNADVFHLHSQSSRMGWRHLQVAKERGIATITSAHVPHQICTRGDFMFEGRVQCTAPLSAEKCRRCYLGKRFRGFAGRMAAMGITYAVFKSGIGRRVLPSITAADRTLAVLKGCLAASDKFVVFADWQKNILERLGPSNDKILQCRQGVRKLFREMPSFRKRPVAGRIKVGFYGRLTEVKGTSLLIEAIAGCDRSDLAFTIVGRGTAALESTLKMLESRDNRVSYIRGLSGQDLVQWLDDLDLLCVPSICAETGPLTTMEALSRGVPVLAFALGGNRELIKNGETGILVNDTSAAGLTRAICALSQATLDTMTPKVSYTRTSMEVALDMIKVYEEIVTKRSAGGLCHT